MMRCQANWAEMAEKPTKYFLNLEKSKFNKKTIVRLINEKGEILNTESQIFDEMNTFYRNLYNIPRKVDESEIENYIESTDLLQISDQTRKELDREIDLVELGKAVFSLKNMKAGRVDGIPIDWYKMFWGKLKIFFLELINIILEKERFHLSTRRGLINLLEKPEKDCLYIKHWRPITLLCADF